MKLENNNNNNKYRKLIKNKPYVTIYLPSIDDCYFFFI